MNRIPQVLLFRSQKPEQADGSTALPFIAVKHQDQAGLRKGTKLRGFLWGSPLDSKVRKQLPL